MIYQPINNNFISFITFNMQESPRQQHQKQAKNQQEKPEIVEIDIELNKSGRPRQKIFYFDLTQDMKEQALSKIQKDNQYLSEDEYKKAEQNGQKVWDRFYQHNKCNFFKDRTYLQRELPEITDFKELHQNDGIVSQYYELGCGVGNTLFPLIKEFKCFKYWGCDISAKAVNMIQAEVDKRDELKDRLKVAVCDLVKDPIPFPKTGDIVSLIFVMSAIVPERHAQVIQKIAQWMKPGSFLYFRDYGRYDFGQVNLSNKGNRKLKDNFYMKNDGVCVYYFEKNELETMFAESGLKKIRCEYCCKMLENRKTGLKMYRVWLQARFYKPPMDQYFESRVQDREKEHQLAKKEREEQLEREKDAEEKVKKQSQKIQQNPQQSKVAEKKDDQEQSQKPKDQQKSQNLKESKQ